MAEQTQGMTHDDGQPMGVDMTNAISPDDVLLGGMPDEQQIGGQEIPGQEVQGLANAQPGEILQGRQETLDENQQAQQGQQEQEGQQTQGLADGADNIDDLVLKGVELPDGQTGDVPIHDLLEAYNTKKSSEMQLKNYQGYLENYKKQSQEELNTYSDKYQQLAKQIATLKQSLGVPTPPDPSKIDENDPASVTKFKEAQARYNAHQSAGKTVDDMFKELTESAKKEAQARSGRAVQEMGLWLPGVFPQLYSKNVETQKSVVKTLAEYGIKTQEDLIARSDRTFWKLINDVHSLKSTANKGREKLNRGKSRPKYSLGRKPTAQHRAAAKAGRFNQNAFSDNPVQALQYRNAMAQRESVNIGNNTKSDIDALQKAVDSVTA